MFLSVVLIQKTPSQVFSYKCCILVGSGYRTHRLRAAVSVARHKAIKVKSLELFLTACMVLKHGLSRWLCVLVWKAWMSLQRLKSNESLTLHNLSQCGSCRPSKMNMFLNFNLESLFLTFLFSIFGMWEYIPSVEKILEYLVFGWWHYLEMFKWWGFIGPSM